jgi:hypothetical protein
MKRTTTYLILVLALLLANPLQGWSQTVEAENEIKLSRKARKGFLASYKQDSQTGDITLVYITKEKRKKVEYEVYVIDGNTYKQKSHKEKTAQLDEFRTSFDDFNVVKEEYSESGIAVKGYLPENGVYNAGAGAIVGSFQSAFATVFKGLELQTYRLDYEYNWDEGRYYYTVDEGDDLNPKIDGLKLEGYDNFTVEEDGNYHLVVLAGERTPTGFKAARDGTIDTDRPKKRMHIMKYNPQGDKTNDVELFYDKPYTFRHGNFINNNQQYAMVLTGPEPQVQGVESDAELVVVDMDGNIQHRIRFMAKQARWKIINIFQEGENYFVYGGAEQEKAGQEDSFQLARINKNGNANVTLTNNETILEGAKGDPDTPYGETNGFFSKWEVKYHPMVQYVTNQGEFVLSGQVAEYKDGKVKVGDVYMLHFDAQGNFVAQYAYEAEENGAVTDQDLMETPNGLQWIVYEAGRVNQYTVDRYPRIASIDLANRSVGEFRIIGDGDYYLYESNGAVYDPNTAKARYFGEDKRGKRIWFARVQL